MEIIKGDLFCSKLSLAHCVSSDLEMGKGIAREFKHRYKQVDELRKQPHSIGDVPYIETNDGRYIFYLVTKERYWMKPTYKTFMKSLVRAKEIFRELNIKDIAIPLLGCGLDRLKWEKVEEMILKVWCDIQVTVYVL